MRIRHLSPEDARLSPRPGEVGVAHEWIVWPPQHIEDPTNDFDVRVSTVELAAPGPLASLDGYDRMLSVIEGEGLILSHSDEAPRASVRRLESYPFQGEWPTEIELTRGVVTGFNVTTRRGQAEAHVEILRLGTRRVMEALDVPAALVYGIRGTLAARITGEEEPFELQECECLWMHELGGGEEIELQGSSTDCEALLVRLRMDRREAR